MENLAKLNRVQSIGKPHTNQSNLCSGILAKPLSEILVPTLFRLTTFAQFEPAFPAVTSALRQDVPDHGTGTEFTGLILATCFPNGQHDSAPTGHVKDTATARTNGHKVCINAV